MTNRDNRNGAPGVWALVLIASVFGVSVIVLINLVEGYPDQPRWWHVLSVVIWGLLVLLDGWGLWMVLRDRRAAREHAGLLEPCESCAGTGHGGPASGPETNGRCWDCLGEGSTPYVS